MKKYLLPSLANLFGAFVGVGVILLDGIVSHRSLGNHRFLNDTTVSIANATGFDAFTVAMVMGAIIALIISFLATHLFEKFIGGKKNGSN